VIGINSVIKSVAANEDQAGNVGLAFAIPINQAKSVAQQLIRTGQPVYPVIGVQVDMRQQGNGARISDSGSGGSDAVTPGGPAAKAGLRPGDVITKLDGQPIESSADLAAQIRSKAPGDKVKVTYQRDGKESTVEVTLGEAN
jgi:putative serine protease PepD